MPSIVAVPYPDRGHVLLEINFADVPGATHVCVTATDTVTGLERQLHSYVSYNAAGCLALSCGQAIMWDTEISCGNPTTYCATGINAAGDVITTSAPLLVADTWTRVTAASWGTPDIGAPWVQVGGAAADYSSTGTRGRQALPVVNVAHTMSSAMTTANSRAQVTFIPGVVATGAEFEQDLRLRSDAVADTSYRIVAAFDATGNVDLFFQRRVAGVNTALGSQANAFPYIASSQFKAAIETWGNQIRAKVWDATTPEPAAWTFTATDTVITAAGSVTLGTYRAVGNTNVGLTPEFDNLAVSDVCADLVPVEICTEEVEIACDGCFRLGNPVRPCDDIRVCLCADGVDCGGEGGVTFVSMTPDTRADNSGQMIPINDIYPIPISRARLKPTSTLTVVPTSFAARDQLIELLAPGEPLLFRTTPEFGIGDRYLQIGDVPETYQIADMRIQPRIMQLPNAEVRGPVGPTLGVCGARVTDLCDVYDTWDEMAAAGLTWADLLRGNASTTPAGLATWDDVNADFADWNALQAGETDWSDVLDGD